MYVHMHTHTHTHNVATNDLYQKIVQKSITINTVVARCMVKIKLANEKFTVFYTLFLFIQAFLIPPQLQQCQLINRQSFWTSGLLVMMS